MSRYAWSMCFLPALLMVGPLKRSTKLLRQTFGERFLTHSLLLTNSRVTRSLSQQLRHKNRSRNLSDVITYPLIQETFAFVESNLECEICRQYFGVGFRSKQIWKRYCKKSVVHYNAIPSLNNWLPLKEFWISGLLDDRLKVTKLTYSRNVAQRPSTKRSQVSIGAWLIAGVARGNLGGSSPNKNNPQINTFAGGFKYRIRV